MEINSNSKSFRIFLEDNEIEIKYSSMTTNDVLQDVIIFIMNEIRKRH